VFTIEDLFPQFNEDNTEIFIACGVAQIAGLFDYIHNNKKSYMYRCLWKNAQAVTNAIDLILADKEDSADFGYMDSIYSLKSSVIHIVKTQLRKLRKLI
jgi:hypothetical protein